MNNTNNINGCKLYPYQEEDIIRMRTMNHVLLFSEMGCGKTIEAIWHVMEFNLFPCLIICPTTLKLNWDDEVIKWTGKEPYYAEYPEDIVDHYFNENLILAGQRKEFFIIHHEALAFVDRDPIRQFLTEMPWRCVVIDESHRFRNEKTNRTETLMRFDPDNTKLMFLTGTPMVNSTYDLYPMLKLIGFAENPISFMNEYCRTVPSQYGPRIVGSRNKEKLFEKLGPIYIRRRTEEVLKDLPGKREITVSLEMPDDQREAYSNLELMMCLLLDDGAEITSPNILSLMTRLRQTSLDPTIVGRATGSSKTRAVQELIDQSPKDKWVVFSTSKKFVNHLAQFFNNGITITGDDKPEDRHKKITRFKSDPKTNVLLMTYKTGGVGINLQFVSHVILTDYWWNSMQTEQAMGRFVRPGQEKQALVYQLHNRTSIDDDMREKIVTKKKMADEIVITQAEMDRKMIEAIYRRTKGIDYVWPEQDNKGLEDVKNGQGIKETQKV